jgi:hypothetical protein
MSELDAIESEQNNNDQNETSPDMNAIGDIINDIKEDEIYEDTNKENQVIEVEDFGTQDQEIDHEEGISAQDEIK